MPTGDPSTVAGPARGVLGRVLREAMTNVLRHAYDLDDSKPIEVVFRPQHEVTIGVMFRSVTLERELAPLVLTAADYLDAEALGYAQRGETFTIG